jgi:hypothetical protein
MVHIRYGIQLNLSSQSIVGGGRIIPTYCISKFDPRTPEAMSKYETDEGKASDFANFDS